ncbi:hypothetical protein B0H13DRAFT_2374472 [Mycena leptocephala]|nr:hypothetical protein B0H13DRAFT_2374472 [Mycena leptocephala]
MVDNFATVLVVATLALNAGHAFAGPIHRGVHVEGSSMSSAHVPRVSALPSLPPCGMAPSTVSSAASTLISASSDPNSNSLLPSDSISRQARPSGSASTVDASPLPSSIDKRAGNVPILKGKEKEPSSLSHDSRSSIDAPVGVVRPLGPIRVSRLQYSSQRFCLPVPSASAVSTGSALASSLDESPETNQYYALVE